MLSLQDLQDLIGIDVDPTAHEFAGAKLRQYAHAELRIHHLQGNFRCGCYSQTDLCNLFVHHDWMSAHHDMQRPRFVDAQRHEDIIAAGTWTAYAVRC